VRREPECHLSLGTSHVYFKAIIFLWQSRTLPVANGGVVRNPHGRTQPLTNGNHSEFIGRLHLDIRHRLIALDELFRGTIDGASVRPLEVVRQALSRNAVAVILAHKQA
jgi:hypothetical protein